MNGKPEGEVRLVHSGSFPFAVDLLLGTYEGQAWVRRALRGKSGWLQVGRASMETLWGRQTATLVAAVTDKGEYLSKGLAQALLDMQSATPREPEMGPDEQLDGQMELAHWDFLGRCDLRHLRMLDQAEADLALRLKAEQARGEAVLREVEAYVAKLHRQRRMEPSEDARSAILARIEMLEQKHEQAAAWLIRHMAATRQEFEQQEADILATLQNHGQLEIIQTVHWTARHPSDRHEQVEQASSLWPRDGIAEDWRGSAGSVVALSRAIQLADLHANVPAEFYRHERLQRSKQRADLSVPEPGEDELGKLARISRAWIKDDEAKRAKAAPVVPRQHASSLRTDAQRRSARRRVVLDERDREIAELIARFPSIAELEAELDRHPGVTGKNRRLARLIRQAMKALSHVPENPVATEPVDVAFPDYALVPTSADQPIPPTADDSIDIDALIESELAEMLKDLRPL